MSNKERKSAVNTFKKGDIVVHETATVLVTGEGASHELFSGVVVEQTDKGNVGKVHAVGDYGRTWHSWKFKMVAGATEWAQWKVRFDELKKELNDYKEMQEDHKRLVKEIDIILSGNDAAEQASLCDLVGPICDLVEEHAPLLEKYDNLKLQLGATQMLIDEDKSQLALKWARLTIEHQQLKVKYDNILATEDGHESQTENVWQIGFAAGHDAGYEKANHKVRNELQKQFIDNDVKWVKENQQLKERCDKMEAALKTWVELDKLTEGDGFQKGFELQSKALKLTDEALAHKPGGINEKAGEEICTCSVAFLAAHGECYKCPGKHTRKKTQ